MTATASDRHTTGGRVWLVTAASRGIGKALVERAVADGDAVVAGCRRPSDLDELHDQYPDRLVPVELDVTVGDRCTAAVDLAVRRFGRVDVLANVAGVGLVSAAEETSLDRARALFDVNFWGPVRMVQAVLPTLRAQRSGHIIQVSSLSGRVGAAGVSFYAASKFALEGFSESLRLELAPLGIGVTIVEPGGVRTDWAGPSLWSEPSSPAYDSTVGETGRILARVHGNQPTSAEQVAESIILISREPEPPRRVTIGPDALQRISASLELELEELKRWNRQPQ